MNVVGFGERRAYVLGSVNRPGPVELHQRMTLTQAVAEVGSFDQNAQVSTVVLLRRKSENAAEAFRLDLRPVVEGKSLAADVILQPDDVIFVPQTFLASMEHFIDQFFGGLLPIPTLFRETYEAIYIRDLAIFRRPVVVGTD